MTPERWQQVERVYYATLAADVSARPRLLDECCAGDDALRREVMALLNGDGDDEHFLSAPALDVVARGTWANGLASGTQIGAYRILAPLGAGGMGEVYRARDTQLGRDVALKILPAIFLADPDRRSRFEREARLLAALNHPHIGAIYGLEDLNGSQVLVLELVDGESLAQRLAAGPLPVSQATGLAGQVADALESAHEKGIVHRDLKPANIMVTADDRVKVLDFGLARASDVTDASNAANSPTLTFGATQAGVLLGTAAYMAPEQAKGRAADKRSDVWAFGCVLYEMLCGRPPFAGATVSDTLASVLRDEPDWSALPAGVPAGLRTLLHRCLEKERKARIPDLAVARFMLNEAPAAIDAPPRSPLARRLITPIAIGLLAAAVTGLVMWTLMRGRPVPAAEPIRLHISPTPPQSLVMTPEDDAPIAISPDGRRMVFVGRASGNAPAQLIAQSLDQLQTLPIPGTEGARNPFFSPNGEWIGYWTGSVLKKVSWNGGPVAELRTLTGSPTGATWLPDQSIILATEDPRTGLIQLPADGGPATTLTKPDRSERDHLYPSVLPGGRAVLFTVRTAGSVENAQVAVLDLTTGQLKTLFTGSDARYVDTGHLVYAATGTLRAVRFDLDRLAVLGDSVPVVDQVMRMINGAAACAVSRNGTLIYVRGAARDATKLKLVWVDRNGREEPLSAEPRAYTHPRISPDGARVAVIRRDQDGDLWIFDLARQGLYKLTSGPSPELNPVWTDSRTLIFASYQAIGSVNVFRQHADGSDGPEPLTSGSENFFPISVTPNGTAAVLVTGGGTMQLALLHLGTGQIDSLLPSTFDVINGEISPDGRWLAYQSNETGSYEVYVRPFPNLDRDRRTISTNGGKMPVWARSGTELFYIDADGHLMGVTIQTQSGFHAGLPTKVFDGRYFSDDGGRTYDVAPDGRFLMLKDVGDPPSMFIVLNWFEDLKKLLPASSR